MTFEIQDFQLSAGWFSFFAFHYTNDLDMTVKDIKL